MSSSHFLFVLVVQLMFAGAFGDANNAKENAVEYATEQNIGDIGEELFGEELFDDDADSLGSLEDDDEDEATSGEDTQPSKPVDPRSNRCVYTRGIGKVLSECREGFVKDGLLCYPPCKTGYKGVAFLCWRQAGVPHSEPLTYPRGPGLPMICPKHLVQSGLLCYEPCLPGFSGHAFACWNSFTISSPLTECDYANGYEKDTDLWCYKKCRKGFYGVGRNCYSTTGVIGPDYHYVRPAGIHMHCKKGWEKFLLHCMKKDRSCGKDYNNIADVCWKKGCSGPKLIMGV